MECKVLERDSLEYRQLELVAQALTKQSKKVESIMYKTLI